MSTWLVYFLVTQIIEVPIHSWPLRGNVVVAFGASALTHPILWFVIVPALGGVPWLWTAVLGETFAVVVEALWLRAFRVRRAFLWSLLANGASFTLGLLAQRIGWLP